MIRVAFLVSKKVKIEQVLVLASQFDEQEEAMCSRAIARFLRFRIFLTISSIFLPRIGSEIVS